MAQTKLDTFTTAYVECALWSSSAEMGDCETCDDLVLTDQDSRCANCGGKVSGTDLSFQDREFDLSDLAPASLEAMVRDCEAFQTDNAELLDSWYSDCGESADRAGHDFWLTRNRHGAGFWDRWNGGTPQRKIGEELTKLAHAYGSCDLYAGDDGKVYAQ